MPFVLEVPDSLPLESMCLAFGRKAVLQGCAHVFDHEITLAFLQKRSSLPDILLGVIGPFAAVEIPEIQSFSITWLKSRISVQSGKRSRESLHKVFSPPLRIALSFVSS